MEINVCTKSFSGEHRSQYFKTAWGVETFQCLECGELTEQYQDCNGG